MTQETKSNTSALDFQKLMLLLAEKRTAHTTLRSGVAVCAFTLTIVSFFITRTAEHSVDTNPFLVAFVLLGACFLFSVGCYLLWRGFVRVRFHDRKISEILRENDELASLFYHKRLDEEEHTENDGESRSEDNGEIHTETHKGNHEEN